MAIKISGSTIIDDSRRLLNVGLSTFSGNIDANGNLDVDGDTELNNLNVSGITTLAGNIFLGEGGNDQINVNGNFISGLSPLGNNQYDLGTNGKNWRDGNFAGIVTSTGLNVSGIITATTFVGALTGNATTATTATTATNVTVTANNNNNENVFPVFVDGATGSQGAETDTNLFYNPNSNIFYAGTFSGSGADLTNLPASTTITVADESSDTTCFPLFVTAATGDLAPKSGSNLTFNSSTGALTATSLTSNDTLTVSGITNLNNDVIFDGASYNASWDKSANTLNLSDNAKATFGTGNDLQIYHDGTESYVDNSTGDLILRSTGDDVIIRATDDVIIQNGGSDNAIICNNDGNVELYFNTAKKFETKTDGVDITGELQCDSLDVDGAADITGDITANGNIVGDNSTNISGINSVTATKFVGDGSELTGISAGGGGGEFNTGITSTVQATPLSFETTMHTFPSTSGRQYVIESINVANVDESVGVGTTVNIIASIQDATAAEQTYIAYNVPIVTGGVIELLKNPIVAGPSDVIRMWTTNDAYVGVNNAADVYINYAEHESTDFISKFAATTTINSTDAITLYTSTSNPTMIEKIGFANRTDTGDFPVSIKITSGTTTSYLAKNLIIPRYSTVDILDRPKRIETDAKIEVEVGSTSTIDVIIAGKKITS